MKRKINVHHVFLLLHSISAILSLIPNAAASKPCRLGYYALCSFTPYSTIISIGLAGLHFYFLTRTLKKNSDTV